MDKVEPHAVRWANHTYMGEMDWGKWHWTEDAQKTLCGRNIRMAIKGGSFLPDCDEGRTKEEITCLQCRNRKGDTNGN